MVEVAGGQVDRGREGGVVDCRIERAVAVALEDADGADADGVRRGHVEVAVAVEVADDQVDVVAGDRGVRCGPQGAVAVAEQDARGV